MSGARDHAGPATNTGLSPRPRTGTASSTLDILFNNLSTGLFLAMAVGELVEPGIFRPLAAVAYPIALILLIADLVCLVLDLGDPSRFHHMLRVWKPSSPMSLGTWVLSGYSGPLTVLTLMSLLPAETGGLEWLRRLLLVVGSALALGAAVYKGVLFSTTAQPGWRDARWLGSYLANSALVLGAAELLLLAIAKGQPEAVSLLRHALMFLLVLNLVVLALVLADVRAALARARAIRLLAAIAAVVFLGGSARSARPVGARHLRADGRGGGPDCSGRPW